MDQTFRPSQLALDRLGATYRRDRWWGPPLIFGAVFLAFVIYTTWALLQGEEFAEVGPYLSPYYSPLIVPDSWPGFVPEFLRTPAILILWVPLTFRMTCYYYRKSYYRSYFLSPPACAVGEGEGRPYTGERSIFAFQNFHRYALPFALALVVFLSYDAVKAFFSDEGFGIGVGTVVLVVNAVAIGGYTLGCHSLRHLIGGGLDCFSCSPVSRVRHRGWRFVTFLNERHGPLAMFSLIWVLLSDLYVRLVAMEVFSDPYFILISAN